jgi:acyl-CoA thioesterase I
VQSASQDLRLCFFGDSYVQGVGDATGAGWVGPVAGQMMGYGTAFNLGVRGDTSLDVQRRWYDEARCRLKNSERYGVLFSFGVNDTHISEGRTRVPHQRSLTVLSALLDDAHVSGWSALVVGPPPPAEDGHRRRVRRLSTDMAMVCTSCATPFVDLVTPLEADESWLAELAAGDGSHPGTAGYWRMASLIDPEFTTWLATLAEPKVQ